MQKITPFLWFDNQAEEAANFYSAVFDEGKILSVVRYTDAGPGPAGSAMVVELELFGQRFTLLNGGPVHKFTEAVSFVVDCETQEEVDRYWEQLTSGSGEEGPCGWLKDKYGLSWQIVPTVLSKYIGDTDAGKASAVTQAMLGMKKLDIDKLAEAYNNA